MSAAATIPQGTVAWFEMVGALMCAAASRAGLPPDLNWSLVERYGDGAILPNGRLQGIRFVIAHGRPSFEVGVDEDARGDVTIEVAATTARELNLLHTADPAYAAALDRATGLGRLRVNGDVSPMAGWLAAIHDPIIDLTG
ncbi:hypothetical protein [Azospirillum picis]|uniref:SCP2 domain-containing protein n=1 Tax=Azospirillum picis TaxID=488438 RepID=A0ABU0MRR2_9PROT|nr:hypothetical protein [Azospirillum picis]MBP2300887.1 hypothetical protein [Azospirillum picis]MDQ0536145.1 hypothetical protein [Azospirillum picis]